MTAGVITFAMTVQVGALTTTVGAEASLVNEALPPVDIQQPTVDRQLCVDTNGAAAGRPHRTTTVTVEVANVASTDPVQFSWTNADIANVTATYLRPGTLGPVFQVVIGTDRRFNGTSTTITIEARRPADPNPAREGFLFNVQRFKNASSCA